jgi:hypothetical protein
MIRVRQVKMHIDSNNLLKKIKLLMLIQLLK